MTLRRRVRLESLTYGGRFMLIPSRRPRFGRILDVVAITLLLTVFAGLAVYHYRRLDRGQEDAELAKELAGQKFDNPSHANDWPQWRGPNRNGVSTESILTAWPADGPKRRWEAKVGEGFASVAVANGRVYTIFQECGNEAVVCWNAGNGA